MAFQSVELLMRAAAVRGELHAIEAGLAQDGRERLSVVQKLMAPASKRLIQLKAVQNVGRFILRPINPIEIRRRQAQHAVRGECSAAVGQESLCFPEWQMLDEVLREDE